MRSAWVVLAEKKALQARLSARGAHAPQGILSRRFSAIHHVHRARTKLPGAVAPKPPRGFSTNARPGAFHAPGLCVHYQISV